MIKVYAIPDNPAGDYNACSYIRLLNPLKELERQGKIKLTISKNWKDGKNCDVFYLQRLCCLNFEVDSALELIAFCRENKKKLIYELDDNLLDLDHILQKSKELVRALIRGADTVVTTTDALKRRLLRLNPHVVVIPNALFSEQIGSHTAVPRHGKIKIGYMGTYSHTGDLQMVLLPLVQILKKYADLVEFELMGVATDMGLLQILPNVNVISISGRDHYPRFWKWVQAEVDWDIGIAPLKLTGFTVCKSDIKFLDYAAMNCCGVFSNHPAYNSTVRHLENGMLADNTAEAWYENMERLILDQDLRERLSVRAREELLNGRLLETNLGRWENLL